MSSWREERRAEKLAERTAAREDRRVDLDARLEAQRIAAEQERLDAREAAEQARRDAREQEELAERRRAEKRRQEQADRRTRNQERDRRRAAWAARIARVVRWLTGNPVDLFVALVMVCSIVPAVVSQVGALKDAGVFTALAVLLATMAEGGAWALTFMGQAAEKRGEPTGKYRVATWLTAGFAAAVNWWHWSQELPGAMWVAVVFAASSLFAVLLWDLRTHSGQHGRTREQRRTAREQRRHLKKRRRHHRRIAKVADRLQSAAEFDTVTAEEAFAAAWRIHTGAEPGMTPELFRRATASQLALGEALEVPDEQQPHLIRASISGHLAHPFRRPLPALPGTLPQMPRDGAPQTATTQFPQGMWGGTGSSPTPAEKPAGTPSGTPEEDPWKKHLGRARTVAAELVAEGKSISATSLAKRLQIRREDATKLRDHIVEERRLKLIGSGGSTAAA